MKNVYLKVTQVLLLLSLLASCLNSQTVSKETIINKAIEFYLTKQRKTYPYETKDGKTENRDLIQYQSKEEFLSDYPDCCTFSHRGSEGHLPSFWYRYKHSYKGVVHIRAGRRFLDNGSIVMKEFRVPYEIYINKSGEPIKARPF